MLRVYPYLLQCEFNGKHLHKTEVCITRFGDKLAKSC
jgi:hypothetical protein